MRGGGGGNGAYCRPAGWPRSGGATGGAHAGGATLAAWRAFVSGEVIVRRWTILAAMLTVIAVTTGCDRGDAPPPQDVTAAALTAMRHAGSYELLSLDPTRTTTTTTTRPQRPQPGRFHGWRVLGWTTVSDPSARVRLADALRAGLREADDAMRATCFNPRHGLRVVHGDRTYDLVICFECGHAQAIEGSRGEVPPVSPSPQPVFDEVLRAAGVPLPAKPE